MTTSSALLEQIFIADGDTLYRMALLLGGDERAADRLLQQYVRDLLAAWNTTPPSHTPDEPTLLAGLIACAQRLAAARPQQRQARLSGVPPLYVRLLSLSIEQRAALALMLINGYDAPRIALAIGRDEAATRTLLIDTIRAVAPAAGRSLTDRVSADLCHDVRAALADPSGRVRHSAAVRGHLAGCAACRSFDLTWGEMSQDVEAALRAVLREQALPTALATRLLQLAQPRRRVIPWRTMRFALPPLAVLLVVAALVLPGFGRRSVTVVSTAETSSVDPQELISRAIAQYGQPFQSGPSIWHGRFETLWYFDDETIAPLQAGLWLDRDQPARHRIQLTHAAGGAPYELQVGDGRDRLYYALDANYSAALYGSLNLRIEPEEPLLLPFALDAEAQRQALQARLNSGPWTIPPFYLRQAAAAADLRLLGRQNDGDRTVQIVSFSGVSPLGHPIDSPGATAERVTVLLAIDPVDGLLYSATELAGPPGGVQTSRTTWRLIDEERFVAPSSNSPFSIERAWNGMGEFPSRPSPLPADLRVPAIVAANVLDPLVLIERPGSPLPAPLNSPPGIERALLLGDTRRSAEPRIDGLLYLGPERMLLIRPINATQPAATEEIQVGDWQVSLTPGRVQRYVARLQRDSSGGRVGRVLIEAQGFSRAELLDLIAGLRPFDVQTLVAQEALFAAAGSGDQQSRTLILAALARVQQVPADQVRYTQWQTYARHGPLRRSDDPYRMPPFNGRPENDTLDTWHFGGDMPVSLQYLGGADPSAFVFYRGVEAGWASFGYASVVTTFPMGQPSLATRLPLPQSYLLDLLLPSDAALQQQRTADGTIIISAATPADRGRYAYAVTNETTNGVYLADVQPLTITTEVAFDNAGTFQSLRVYASGGLYLAQPIVIESFELRAEALLPLAEAPPALRTGQQPPADLRVDLEQVPSAEPVFTLAQVLRRAETPIFVLPPERAILGTVLAGSAADVNLEPLIEQAIDLQIAALLVYRVPAPAESDVAYREFSVVQGAAGPLRAYLRASFQPVWIEGNPLTTMIAGRERTAWIGTLADQTRLVAELDGTLMMVTGPSEWFEEVALPLLAELAPA